MEWIPFFYTLLLLLLLASWFTTQAEAYVVFVDGFQVAVQKHHWKKNNHGWNIRNTQLDATTPEEVVFQNGQKDNADSFPPPWDTKHSTFVTTSLKTARPPTLRRRLFRRLFRRPKEEDHPRDILYFDHDFDQLEIGNNTTKNTTTGVVLIHPIGVGISKWFYHRLLNSLAKNKTSSSCRLVIVSPDLLGSGSACNPTTTISNNNGQQQERKQHLPLLNISDWSDQLEDLMTKIEEESSSSIDRWCLVANGGCSPIAIQVAQRSVQGSASFFPTKVSNVILSSVPRLPFFLPTNNNEDHHPSKVHKSYRMLCGIIGNLFWWYACRKQGAFIQKFSETNLVADPANLGDQWRPNCYETARLSGGKSKYATFAFLAGTLQDGCVESLNVLLKEDQNNNGVRIDIIQGRDVRRNKAKSWFWQKSKRKPVKKEPHKTFRDFLEENGNRGKEILIGGRISLAHEDPEGYSSAILEFLGED